MTVQGKNLTASMNARILGSGNQTIVLAHGFGGDQTLWDKITPCLSKHFQVLVFDWHFSGAVKDQTLYDPLKYTSYDDFADDLINLLDEMSVKSTVLVGHSMSGIIGCIVSIKRPDLIQKLVLIAVSPRFINTSDYEGGFSDSDIAQLISSMESNYQNWATVFAPMAVGATDTDSVDKFLQCLMRMKPEHALSVIKTAFYSDHRDVLEKVTIPCTIVQTTKDHAIPNSVAYYMDMKIQGRSTVEIIETSGHLPQLTAHEKLLDILGVVLGLEPKQGSV